MELNRAGRRKQALAYKPRIKMPKGVQDSSNSVKEEIYKKERVKGKKYFTYKKLLVPKEHAA